MVNDAAIKAASIDRLGVKIKPTQMAKTIWKESQGNKVLWRVGADARILNIGVRLFGSAVRGITK